MNQRSTIVAVWTALLVAVGIALSLSMAGSDRAGIEPAVSEQPTRGARGVKAAVRPWPEATEVRLFVEDLSYDERERTGATMSNPKGVALTATQRATLDESVTLYRMTAKEYGDYAAACFIPHHFFRYYDTSGRRLGELSVCYCCDGIEFSPAFQQLCPEEEWQFDFDGVEKMLKEMGVPTDVNCL